MSNYTENQMTEDQNHAWRKLLKFIPNDKQVLDIGCSSGSLGELLAKQRGCVVDGVEPDKEDAGLASKKLRKVWNSDIETAVKDIHDKYDVLIFADVLEHLLYPGKVLWAARSLLKPTGRVVFSVPNMAHISVRLALLAGDWRHTETGLLDKTHLHYWDIDTIKDVFKEAGMNLVELDAVTYKYPEKLIQDRLNDIGLRADKKGLNLLASKEASAFQIIGFAEFSKSRHSKAILPEPRLQKDISYLAQYLEDHIKNLEEHIKNLEEYIRNSEEHTKQIERQLKDIKSSRYYKLRKNVSSFKSKFTKR